ncbi:hypothetical protein JR316_0008340 [Psilocybe cubensis]|uniref:Uncharacterized protein n=2 Tax=Psilocybe cubensis TaxID=181762 RepID=A0A8H7XTJ8_PSICU|nr:hypothetical protein JR316_0008340 [Psilocybe cubensis]KAH9479745.1 hypothetical protein JR316_0008340 [Psilocybe cubensis]
MNRGSPSPIFDVPEFPALRRVKPLPKRRRTTVSADNENGLSMSSTPSGIPIPDLPFFEHIAQQVVQRHLAMANGATSVEDLVVESDELMGSLSLQDYYLPPMAGSQRFMGVGETDVDGENRNASNAAAAAAAAAISAVTAAGRNGQIPLPMSDLDSLEFGVHFAAAAAAAAAAGVAMGSLGSLGLGLAGMSLGSDGADVNGPNADAGSNLGRNPGGRSRDEDDGRGDGDYMDHLRQPGNTKKRKVPANMSPGGPEGTIRPGSPSSGYLEEDGGSLEGGPVHSFEDDDAQLQFQRERDRERERERERSHSPNFSNPAHPYPPAPFPGQLAMVARKRGKLMAVTLAGLQHKELLKSRKRQLAAVMGALSHGDTLALDQALTSASYGYRAYGAGGLSKTNSSPDSSDDPHAQARAQGLSVRKSKRRTVRLARAMKIMLAMPQRRIRHPDAVPFPECEFEFSCPSGTADRLIATKEEVASLRKRFEAELEKQAAKAAKMAVAAAATAHGGSGGTGGGAGGDGTGKSAKATGGKGKRERQERDRERAERAQAQMQAQAAKTKDQQQNVAAASVTTVTPTANTTAPSSNAGDHGVASGGTAASGGGKPKGKKKKRSTLANASNPHHLKNYVPSRLPHSGDGHHGAAGAYLGVSPLPIKFLTAQIPPRRKRGQGKRDKENTVDGNTPPRGTPTAQANHGGSLIPLKNPAEEWICAFCEYDLFYGSEAAFRKAVRNRKKILKRRRRARERAAKAASGKLGATAHHPPAPPPSEEGEGDDEDLYEEEEEVADVHANGDGQGLKAGRWKGGRGPDG